MYSHKFMNTTRFNNNNDDALIHSYTISHAGACAENSSYFPFSVYAVVVGVALKIMDSTIMRKIIKFPEDEKIMAPQ